MFSIEIQNDACEPFAAALKSEISSLLASVGYNFQAARRPDHIRSDFWLEQTLHYIKPASYVENLIFRHIANGTEILAYEAVCVLTELINAPAISAFLYTSQEMADALSSNLHLDMIVDVNTADVKLTAERLFAMHQLLMHRTAWARTHRCLPSVMAASSRIIIE